MIGPEQRPEQQPQCLFSEDLPSNNTKQHSPASPESSASRLNPDFDRWPTTGLPPIAGGGDPEIDKPEEDEEQMVTVNEAAAILGITPQHMRKIIADGHVRVERLPGTVTKELHYKEMVHVSLEDLMEYRRTHRRGRPKQRS